MRSDVRQDWDWSDGYLGEIAKILRRNAHRILSIKVAGCNKDLKHATDMVIAVEGGDVAVRVRRAEYRKKWRDLTIRSWRAGGIKTELHKIKEGAGDWYLYAWSDGDKRLSDWMLVDLNKVRESGLLNRPERANKDGRTRFIAISDKELRRCGCMVSEATDETPVLDYTEWEQ